MTKKPAPQDPSQLRSTAEWQSLAGEYVEVRQHGRLYRKGRVDAVMPDSSGVWMAAEGTLHREYIEKERGFEIWSTVHLRLYPRSPFHP